jgi:hypothetical protein
VSVCKDRFTFVELPLRVFVGQASAGGKYDAAMANRHLALQQTCR